MREKRDGEVDSDAKRYRNKVEQKRKNKDESKMALCQARCIQISSVIDHVCAKRRSKKN